MGRGTAGVRGIKPKEGDYVVGLALVDENGTLLVAAENGIGKRSPFTDYRLQSRGGTGIITMKCTEKTGEVVGATTVYAEDELMLITSSGQSIRISCASIRETGRATQGVKLVTLKEGEHLQDIARLVPDLEADDEVDEESEGEVTAEDGAEVSESASETSSEDSEETNEPTGEE
jgi:DNA gyrase subunit A